jgi:hypothetical protein
MDIEKLKEKRACKYLTDSIKGRHKWLRKQIREEEKITNPTILQQYNLCLHYQTLYHAPFMDDMEEFYECCKMCKLKQDSEIVFSALFTHGKK